MTEEEYMMTEAKWQRQHCDTGFENDSKSQGVQTVSEAWKNKEIQPLLEL